MGTCLLKDDYFYKIGELEKKHGSDVKALVEEIFHRWTDGKGATPISWAGLVTCLRFAELNTLADDIESAYCANMMIIYTTVGAFIVTACFVQGILKALINWG